MYVHNRSPLSTHLLVATVLSNDPRMQATPLVTVNHPSYVRCSSVVGSEPDNEIHSR